MIKINYYGKENNTIGVHSYYAVPLSNGTLEFEQACEESCRNLGVLPSQMRLCVQEFMKTVQMNLLKGFRVQLGDEFLTLYPNLTLSVKDTVQPDGTKKVATASMLRANLGKSRIGCTVHFNFSNEFARNVSWQRVNERTGAVVDDPAEDITQPDTGSEDTSADAGDGDMGA